MSRVELPPPELTEMGRPRLRPPRERAISIKVLVLLAVSAVAVVIGRGIVKYEPDLEGNVGSAGAPGIEVLDGGSFRFRRGAEFFYGFSIRNHGRWGITVTRVIAQPNMSLLRLLEARVSDESLQWKDARPFHPFALQAGAEGFIVIRAVMRGTCQGPGVSQGPGSHSIEYRFLGLTHRTSVPIDLSFGAKVPADCPPTG